MNIPLTITPSTPFSPDPTWTVDQFHQELAGTLAVSTTSANVILGQAGGTIPGSNIGPWLNGTTWYAWDAGALAYKPATVKVGTGANQVTLAAATLTANRTITFPDASGTLALTSDVNRATIYPTLAANMSLDWSASTSFGIPLDRPITLTQINSVSGQEVQIAIYNGPTLSYGVTWVGVAWPNGIAPTMTAGGGPGHLDMYFIRNMGGSLFGRAIQNY